MLKMDLPRSKEKRRTMEKTDGAKEDMQRVGVTEEGVEDRVK